MAYHRWDDDMFDWSGLEEAMNFISNSMLDRVGVPLRMKEKYGNIRYEWLEQTFDDAVYGNNYYPEEVEHALRCTILDAIRKYPHLRREIVADIRWRFNPGWGKN